MSGKILIVDDDANVLDILQRTLARRGHSVQVAATGAGGLALYQKSRPDMVVLDVMLPDMDGRDLWQEMATVGGAQVPVLFLSASTDPDIKHGVLDRGAEDFISKPFSLREVNAKVRNVLSTYERTRALVEKQTALETEVTAQNQNNEQASRELKKQLLSLKTLFTVSQDMNRRLDLDELINRFALSVVGELQISSLAVFTREREEGSGFMLHTVKGFDKDRIADLRISPRGAFVDWLVSLQRPGKLVRSNDTEWVGRLPDVRLAVFEFVTPIIVKQKLRGIVFSGPKLTSCDYTQFDLDMLKSLCNSAGIGIDNARLFHELQNTYLSTVKALVSLIEAKDAYTKGHTERVADYSVALSKRLGLTKRQIRDVAFGAVLHDIGKLMIYEKILNKPGSLDEDEWEELKKHPQVGASIIENIDFLSGTVALVRHHHERWDGGGYPDGLSGEDIPIGARIIAVTDSFDAMTTDRSYRKALTWQQAVENLQSKSGSQFDPRVIDRFVELVQQDRFRNRKFDQFAAATRPL